MYVLARLPLCRCVLIFVVFGFRFSVPAMKTHSKEAEVVFYRCLFAIRGELRVRFSDFSVYLCDSVFPAAGFQLVAIYVCVYFVKNSNVKDKFKVL